MKVYHKGFNLYRQFMNGESLVENFIDFSAENLRQIEVSYTYAVLLVADSLIFYGANSKPTEIQKFKHKIKQISCNETKILVLFENGNLAKISKDNVNDIQELPKLLNGSDKICKISANSKITIGQSISGKFFNISNQLSFENRGIVNVQTGREHCLLLDSKGNVYSFGIGSRGQLGHGSLDNEIEPKFVEALGGIPIETVAAGGWHSCAVSKEGDVYVWGWNGNGQLGLATNKTNDDEVTAMATPQVLNLEVNVKKVACGARHTIVLLDNGQLFGCGWNKYKQLKNEETEIFSEMTYLHDFSKETVLDVKCGPWNSLVLCEG